MLIKVNQIGTLTETFRTMLLARQHGYHVHRLAPAAAKRRTISSPTWPSAPPPTTSRSARVARSERLAKYNRLLRIAEEL